MRIIFIFIVTSLFYFPACKKGPQCDPEIVSEDRCEAFSQRIYPTFNIVPESEAYYTAIIEGNKTSVSAENEGIAYISSVASRYTTSEPSLDPSKQDSSQRILRISFSLYKPASLVDKAPGIISFFSPPLPKTGKISLSYIDSLLAPGVKYVDCGDPEKRGWNIDLSIFDKITDPEQRTFFATPFHSMNRWAPSDFNHFEITKMEKNDLGELMRCTIWVDFQADMHRHAKGKGKFFCRVENGKAKLFVDIRK